MVFSILRPKLYVRTLHDIDLAVLQKNNIQGVVFDLDNTLVPWNQEEMNPSILQWMQTVQIMGFKVVLVSNNKHDRVQKLASTLTVPFVSRALKPVKTGFRQALELMKLDAIHVAVVGDQLFTDVLGGNRLGMYTIWVESLSKEEFIGTRITRQFEQIAVKFLHLKSEQEGKK